MKLAKKKICFLFFSLLLFLFVAVQSFRLNGNACEVVNSKPTECFIGTIKGDVSSSVEFFACTYDWGGLSFAPRGMVFYFDRKGNLLYFSREFNGEYRPESFFHDNDHLVENDILYLLPNLEIKLNPSLFRRMDAKLVQNICKIKR